MKSQFNNETLNKDPWLSQKKWAVNLLLIAVTSLLLGKAAIWGLDVYSERASEIHSLVVGKAPADTKVVHTSFRVGEDIVFNFKKGRENHVSRGRVFLKQDNVVFVKFIETQREWSTVNFALWIVGILTIVSGFVIGLVSYCFSESIARRVVVFIEGFGHSVSD